MIREFAHKRDVRLGFKEDISLGDKATIALSYIYTLAILAIIDQVVGNLA